MADVPVGAFLSGGVDSSTNVALMSRLVSTPLQTFTVEFTGFGPAENFHDVPYARQVASMFGCDHTEVQVTAAEALAYLPEMVQQQDEPLGDPACLPMHFVSRAAHEAGIKVVLVGEGSDEVFGGYPSFPTLLETSTGRGRSSSGCRGSLRRAVQRGAALVRRAGGRIDVLRRAADDEPLYWGSTWCSSTGRRSSSTPRPGGARCRARRRTPRPRTTARSSSGGRGADFSQQMSYVELRNRLPELLLMRVDKFSMAHSLEARAPFLDHQLASYALSLPAALKMQGTRTKAVLKDAVRAWLPEEVVERTKQGFRVPLPAWLRGELAPWAEDVLRRSPLRQLGIFDFDHISTCGAATSKVGRITRSTCGA